MADDSQDPTEPTNASNPREAGARGGLARAANMTPEARSAGASLAARARWSAPREVAAGEVKLLPNVAIPCAVLDNGMRVLSTRGVSRAFGSKKTGTDATGTGAPQPPPFLASKAIKPHLPAQLTALLNAPIVYLPKTGGRTAYGYDCSVFPLICKAIVAADRAGALRKLQSHREMAALAGATLEALVGVAMVSLIDEATGYEKIRIKDELQTILRNYVVEEMLPWVQRFPEEFFRQIYKLNGWPYQTGQCRHPGRVGHIINEAIYRRLPPPVLPRLQELNPVVDGRRRAKHHQFLTRSTDPSDITGIRHLDEQIIAVTALMRGSLDMRMFEGMLHRAYPVNGDQMNLAAVDVPANGAAVARRRRRS